MATRAALASILVGIAALLLYCLDVPVHKLPLLELGRASNEWDIFYHLGGYSPWIPKKRAILEGGIAVPDGCIIDQIHMMSRHGERYPTFNPGIRMLELYQRLQHANLSFAGDLAFVNSHDFFAPFPNAQFEQLTSTGPYAGTLQSFATGVKLRTRYERLLELARARNQTSFWASQSDRVVDTARLFATGFFGLEWEEQAQLHIIPESPDRGANTLTPGRTCPNYASDPKGHRYGVENLMAFRSSYLPAISKRLLKQNPNITFSEAEIYSMQEMCGFEILAKGQSKWCDVFTRDELLSFEYARDLLHYYRAGPGNPFGASMGWLWLNATANLLKQGPDAGPMFLSFNHDGDIVAMLAALDLFRQEPHLPNDRVLHNRTWRMSDVTPMGGRIILERIVCPATQICWNNAEYGYPNHLYCAPPANDTFVRVNVNDGIVPIPDCTDGPKGSCPLEKFLQRVQARGEELEDFSELCGLPDEKPDRITFLHQ